MHIIFAGILVLTPCSCVDEFIILWSGYICISKRYVSSVPFSSGNNIHVSWSRIACLVMKVFQFVCVVNQYLSLPMLKLELIRQLKNLLVPQAAFPVLCNPFTLVSVFLSNFARNDLFCQKLETKIIFWKVEWEKRGMPVLYIKEKNACLFALIIKIVFDYLTHCCES